MADGWWNVQLHGLYFPEPITSITTNAALPVNVPAYYCWHGWFMEGHDSLYIYKSIKLYTYIHRYLFVYIKNSFFPCSNTKDKKDLHSIWNKEHLKSAPWCSSFLEMEMEPLIPNPQQLMMEKYYPEICSRRADGAGALLCHNDVMQKSSYGVIFHKYTSNCSLSSN